MAEPIFASPAKFLAGWLVVFLIRLIPWRAPNVEPVLGTLMPFSKYYGWLGAFVFGFTSIALFDAITLKVGSWTLVTASTYGAIGILSYLYFKRWQASVGNYFIFAIIGTLIYDAITGVIMGPLMFGQPIAEAFIGQIPFTMLHLAGNLGFALTLSPLVDFLLKKSFATVPNQVAVSIR